jgi:hypothetical protein
MEDLYMRALIQTLKNLFLPTATSVVTGQKLAINRRMKALIADQFAERQRGGSPSSV